MTSRGITFNARFIDEVKQDFEREHPGRAMSASECADRLIKKMNEQTRAYLTERK